MVRCFPMCQMNVLLNDKSSMIGQFVKYLFVGALNTSVTLAVIWLCRSQLDMNEYLSNAIGYVIGLINSFIWNKKWVFQAKGNYVPQFCRFIIGFALCYLLQLVTVWGLVETICGKTLKWTVSDIIISGYGIATFVGMLVYTVANYVYNRMVAFRN